MKIHPTSEKIISRDRLPARLIVWRLKEDKIVFTNGCFDILHLGHVEYLETARNQGTRLIIGLNSDSSMRLLNKNPGSPYNNENARARVLAALQFVDAVVLFDEETPLELISLVRPDILVKGGDYSPLTIVGADLVSSYGGIVKTIPLTPGYSTSAMVQKIRSIE